MNKDPINENEEISYDFHPGPYVEHLDKCRRYYAKCHLTQTLIEPDSSSSSSYDNSNDCDNPLIQFDDKTWCSLEDFKKNISVI